MDKATHGRALAAAMASNRVDRSAVASHLHVDVRTVTNWTSGRTMPTEAQKVILRTVIGDYDNPGDPVVIAIEASELTEDRQYEVIGFYKRRLREQRQEEHLSAATPSLRSVAKPGGLEPEDGDLNMP